MAGDSNINLQGIKTTRQGLEYLVENSIIKSLGEKVHPLLK